MKQHIGIITLIKDEHPYLKDWIEYHIKLGFTNFYIFEDVDSKSHADIVKDYPQVVLESASVLNIDTRKNSGYQRRVFVEGYKKHSAELDWVAFIDIDEYVTLEDGYTLDMILDEFDDENGIYLYWNMIAADGEIFFKDEPVANRFKTAVEMPSMELALSLKSFVHCSKHDVCLKNHHLAIDLVTTLHHKTPKLRILKKIWINHYYTKSWEEWCWRFIKRGDIFPNHRKLREFFEYNPDMKPKEKECLELFEQWKNNNGGA